MSGQKTRRRRTGVTTEPVSAPVATTATTLGDGTGTSFPAGLPLYTVRDIALHLKVSRNTIRKMVTLGQIPYVRVGKQIRFDPVAVRSRLDKAT